MTGLLIEKLIEVTIIFQSESENFQLSWLPYFDFVKKLNFIFLGGWRTKSKYNINIKV